MILPRHRKVASFLCRIGVFLIRRSFFGVYHVYPRPWARWIFNYMLRRQVRDGLHHAPACPGNEWSGEALVFQDCTCGARNEHRNPAG